MASTLARGGGPALGRGPLWLAAAVLLMVTGSRQELTLVLIGATCVLTGAAQLLDWALGRWTGMRPASRARLTYSLTGAGLLALWGLPWDRLLPAAPAAADVAAVFGAGSTALYFILRAAPDRGGHSPRRLQRRFAGLGDQPSAGSPSAGWRPCSGWPWPTR